MKKYIFIALVIASQISFAQTVKDWKTLTKSDFSISYPDSLQLDTSKLMDTSFFLFTKQTSATDNFKENINLIVQDLGGQKINLKQYTELSKKQIKQLITNSKMIKSEERTLHNKTFNEFIYTGEQGQFKLTFHQYAWISNGKAYILTFSTKQSTYDLYKDIGVKIMNSFILK